MSRTICLDFGNTRLKCAVFSGSVLEKLIILEDGRIETIRAITDTYMPENSILSSVIDHDPEIEMWLKEMTHFHKLNHLSKLPITTPVANPSAIGADRIALAVAAAHQFPKSNRLVVGLGSAITYNFVNRNDEFMGGSISPGMEMRFKSLNTFTAKLPLVKAEWNFPLIGYDTKTNILSGVIFGIAKEIDGTAEAYQEKYHNFNVLLSGGDSNHLSRFLKCRIFVDPDLIFKGLYLISEFNLDH